MRGLIWVLQTAVRACAIDGLGKVLREDLQNAVGRDAGLLAHVLRGLMAHGVAQLVGMNGLVFAVAEPGFHLLIEAASAEFFDQNREAAEAGPASKSENEGACCGCCCGRPVAPDRVRADGIEAVAAGGFAAAWLDLARRRSCRRCCSYLTCLFFTLREASMGSKTGGRDSAGEANGKRI